MDRKPGKTASKGTGDRTGSPVRPVGPEFLIIYHDLLGTPAKDLAIWKNSQGLCSKAVATSEILDETIGPDGANTEYTDKNAIAIKRCIRRRMGYRSNLRYVLLFGGSDLIETEILNSDPNEANSGYASDYYFSTLEDQNPSTANIIQYPELAIGRLPVSSEQEGRKVVDRIIRYEKDPHIEHQRRKFTLAIEPPIDSTDREGHRRRRATGAICDYLKETYDIELIDCCSAEATDNIAKAAEEGRFLIAHRGHGCEQGWMVPQFRISDLKTCKFPALFYCVDCLSGKFNRPSGQDSFAEAILKSGAAISVIAATGVTNEVLNNYFIQALFDATFGGFLPAWSGAAPGYHLKRTRLGDVLVYAKTYLPFVLGTKAPDPGRLTDETTLSDLRVRNQLVLCEIRKMFEMYHLLGDPTLALRT